MLLVTYKVLDFREGTRADGFKIDKESFVKTVDGEKFRQLLKRKVLFGCNSHGVRNEFENMDKEEFPSITCHADYIYHKGLTSNTIADMRVEGDEVFADLLILDTEHGLHTQMMLSSGIDMEVSLSTYAILEDEVFYVSDINGVDFTTDPAFNTSIVNIGEPTKASLKMNNFSARAGMKEEAPQGKLINFSSSDLVDIKQSTLKEGESEVLQNFSNASIEGISDLINFSIVDYMRDKRLSPRIALRKRINQITRYIRARSKATGIKDRDLLVEYLNSYIHNFIFNYMQNIDDSAKTNLMITLGLRDFIDDHRPVIELQRLLRRADAQLSSGGYIIPNIQKKLNEAYNEFLHEILKVIDSEKLPEDKQGVLSQVS